MLNQGYGPVDFAFMKKTSMMVLVGIALIAAGCSRSGNDAAKPALNTPNLKADAERLRQATAKAAEARKREEEAAKSAGAATATPAP